MYHDLADATLGEEKTTVPCTTRRISRLRGYPRPLGTMKASTHCASVQRVSLSHTDSNAESEISSLRSSNLQ